MSRLRKRLGDTTQFPEVSLTPLIDTALTLLIIFMVAAPMMQNNIKVNLPNGASKELNEQQEFVVTLTKQGQLFFNNYPVAHSDLAAKVTDAMAQQLETPIYIRADKKIDYGQVIDVVESLKKAGIQQVALSIEMVA